MKLPAGLINLNSRFNAMSLRERALIAAAALAILILAWDQLLMSPLHAEKQRLSAELEQTQKSLVTLTDSIQGRANDNPLAQAMEQQKSLREQLAAVDEQLQSESAGLIAPPRMLEALRDVLSRQSGLRLISMRNLPVTSLIAPPPSDTAQGNTQTQSPAASQPMQGPYVHALELVVEGGYLDVLRYLQAVEALPWRFYWQALELRTVEYPMNRVRIRLNTLSMDKEWLGV
jgi:MSHA biogenesis protein MshJ